MQARIKQVMDDVERMIAASRQRRQAMAALREQGWTLQAIADRYGISRQRVDQILRRGG